MALALIVALLFASGTFLILRRGLLRVIVGFTLLSHAVNLLIVTSGGPDRRVAAMAKQLDPRTTADPLPQALVLTAIVISLAVTILMLGLAVVGDGDDDTELDLTDRKLERPELIDVPGVSRPPARYEVSDWHAYLDRADDVDDAEVVDTDENVDVDHVDDIDDVDPEDDVEGEEPA